MNAIAATRMPSRSLEVASCRSGCVATLRTRWRATSLIGASTRRASRVAQPLGPLQVKEFADRDATCARAAASDMMSTGNKVATVEEMMTPHPMLLTEDMPIQRAARLLLDQDISGAPVVDASGALVGILSESDLIWKDHFIIPPTYIGFADLLLQWRDNKLVQQELQKVLAKTVGEAMSRDPVCINPEMTMTDAAALMLLKKVNRLPVVEGGRVVGILTRHDVVRALVATHSPLL